jgi:hypothetical protein
MVSTFSYLAVPEIFCITPRVKLFLISVDFTKATAAVLKECFRAASTYIQVLKAAGNVIIEICEKMSTLAWWGFCKPVYMGANRCPKLLYSMTALADL